ncbi:MAG: hypothetical protein U0939_06030 [Pirellulales bacterium]
MNESANGQYEEPCHDECEHLEEEQAAEEQAAEQGPGLMSRAIYSTCYCLSFGVAFPALFAVRALPENNPIRAGLRDGFAGAADSSDRARARLGQTACAAREKVEGAYASVAQRVQEKVESVQDSLAERRYQRRLGQAAG